jgi:hypothetical protein
MCVYVSKWEKAVRMVFMLAVEVECGVGVGSRIAVAYL